jgi:hypothetical protein
MVLHIIKDGIPRADPFFRCRIVPKTTGSYVLDDVLSGKSFTRITTGRLSVAIDAGQAKDVVERLVSLRRKYNRRSKTSYVRGKMNQKVKFRLAY